MRNFTRLLLLSFVLFSCSKQNDGPGGTTAPPPAKPPAPVTKVTILINDSAMNITSLTYQRYGSGMTITASNNAQKVTADVTDFYQQGWGDMIYLEEVSYFTRPDTLSGWGAGYTRPIPRDDEVRFDNFTPMSDSVVTGNFSGSFNHPGGEGQAITVKGDFKLVFTK